MLLSDGSFCFAGKCSSIDSAKSVCEVYASELAEQLSCVIVMLCHSGARDTSALSEGNHWSRRFRLYFARPELSRAGGTPSAQWHSISHSRPHSPSEAGRKTRPLAFVTQRVTTTLIANRLPLGDSRRCRSDFFWSSIPQGVTSNAQLMIHRKLSAF